jgi:hypothetical protein
MSKNLQLTIVAKADEQEVRMPSTLSMIKSYIITYRGCYLFFTQGCVALIDRTPLYLDPKLEIAGATTYPMNGGQ